MSDNEAQRPRRDFLGLAVGGSATAFAAAITYPAARFAEPEARVATGPVIVGKVDEFPPGGARTVLAHERPVMVVRGAEGRLRAFSAICSHLQCVVGWSAERGRIECPCHGGVYSADGEVLAGPPRRKLEELEVTVNEGAVIVGGPV
jgi:cytochrome b6-f complex iron-sulfur subunit